MNKAFLLSLVVVLSGCAGELKYARPSAQTSNHANYKIINKSRDVVWNSSVPELGKRFFVINNIDKSSGLINISYNGDPERYIDCGRITSRVSNMRGERTYDFPGAKAQQSYEVMNNGNLFFMNRTMSLEGRVNLIFEDSGQSQTKVTVSTRYVVQKTIHTTAAANNSSASNTETISFNSGGTSSFSKGTECLANGELESEILSVIN